VLVLAAHVVNLRWTRSCSVNPTRVTDPGDPGLEREAA
jgi:hypothetical protein